MSTWWWLQVSMCVSRGWWGFSSNIFILRVARRRFPQGSMGCNWSKFWWLLTDKDRDQYRQLCIGICQKSLEELWQNLRLWRSSMCSGPFLFLVSRVIGIVVSWFTLCGVLGMLSLYSLKNNVISSKMHSYNFYYIKIKIHDQKSTPDVEYLKLWGLVWTIR